MPEDFISSLQLCRGPRPAEVLEPILWAGVSMFDNLRDAENFAIRYSLGRYIAEVHIPPRAPAVIHVVVQKTRGPGHYTVLGCAQILSSLVVDTTAVSA